MLEEREPHHERDGQAVVPADLLHITGQLVARRRASPNTTPSIKRSICSGYTGCRPRGIKAVADAQGIDWRGSRAVLGLRPETKDGSPGRPSRGLSPVFSSPVRSESYGHEPVNVSTWTGWFELKGWMVLRHCPPAFRADYARKRSGKTSRRCACHRALPGSRPSFVAEKCPDRADLRQLRAGGRCRRRARGPAACEGHCCAGANAAQAPPLHAAADPNVVPHPRAGEWAVACVRGKRPAVRMCARPVDGGTYDAHLQADTAAAPGLSTNCRESSEPSR